MAFDKEYIKTLTPDNDLYEMAEGIFKSREGTLCAAKSFWKNEITVMLTYKNVKSKLVVSGDRIISYDCSCDEFTSGQMCVHCILAALKYMERRNTGGQIVYSSPDVRTLIGAYNKMAMGEAYGAANEKKLTLEPVVKFDGQNLGVEFVINGSKKYLIKNILAFKMAFEHGEYVEYTKDLKFYHSLSSFDEKSHPLIRFIISVINDQMEFNRKFNKYGVEIKYQKSIYLSEKYFDVFMSLIENDKIELEISRKRAVYNIIRKNPKLVLYIDEISSNGVSIYLKENVRIINGADNMYICIGDNLYICDERYKHYMTPVLNHLVSPIYNEKQKVTFNSRDMGEFTAGVLPLISEYLNIETELDLDVFKPPELKTFLYLDVSDDKVTCNVNFEYDSISYNPLDDSNMPKVYHDKPAEYRVMTLLKRYFTLEGAEMHINMQDDSMFELIDTGINELTEMAEVFISDELKKVSVVRNPNIFVGVSVKSGLLELDIETDGINDNELKDVLSSYKLKKKYHRLKNGEFVRLMDNGIATIADISGGLNITDRELKNRKIELPLFRTLYVDSVLRESNGVTYKRDRDFKEIVRNIKAVEDGAFEIPKSLHEILRPYQKTGFFWLKTMSEYGLGGILADDMGLGKTLQIIALLVSEIGKSHSLIITPASLIYNWENEIKKFAPELKVLPITGPAAERKELISRHEEYDVIITSYDLLRRDIQMYADITFKYEIIDEAQYIKNHGTQSARVVKAIKAQTKYALTGTPIENRLSELWSIFDYLMPGFLFTYQNFKKNFEMPIIQYQSEDALARLKHLIAPFIMRRLKKDVLKDLPPKQENTLYAVLEGEQKKLYKANVAKLLRKLDSQTDSEYSSQKLMVLSEITKLRQICCHPSLAFSNYNESSAKLETCIQLVHDSVDGGHKLLIFSQFTSMLDIIAKRLEADDIKYYYLSGATGKEQRISMVSGFNEDDIPVFLISLKAGGTGLNLTAADVVIHYDPWWNIAAQNQATDRVHRIGQKNKVSVYKLIAKGTIEEKILNIQEKKKNLADNIISENEDRFGRFTKDDIINILREEV